MFQKGLTDTKCVVKMILDTKCINGESHKLNEVIILQFIIFLLTIEIQGDMAVLLLKGRKKK